MFPHRVPANVVAVKMGADDGVHRLAPAGGWEEEEEEAAFPIPPIMSFRSTPRSRDRPGRPGLGAPGARRGRGRGGARRIGGGRGGHDPDDATVTRPGKVRATAPARGLPGPRAISRPPRRFPQRGRASRNDSRARPCGRRVDTGRAEPPAHRAARRPRRAARGGDVECEAVREPAQGQTARRMAGTRDSAGSRRGCGTGEELGHRHSVPSKPEAQPGSSG